MSETYKQTYKQVANIEIQQSIDDNSYGVIIASILLHQKMLWSQ